VSFCNTALYSLSTAIAYQGFAAFNAVWCAAFFGSGKQKQIKRTRFGIPQNHPFATLAKQLGREPINSKWSTDVRFGAHSGLKSAFAALAESASSGLMHRSKKGGNRVVSRTERFRRVIRCGAQQDIARWIRSKRTRRWLHRLRAEYPGGVPLWAANFRYGELPCILPVTDFLVLRARQ
jgi:hypothetical protein